jgi:hypothetical protein
MNLVQGARVSKRIVFTKEDDEMTVNFSATSEMLWFSEMGLL